MSAERYSLGYTDWRAYYGATHKDQSSDGPEAFGAEGDRWLS